MYGGAIAPARYTHRLGVASGAFAVHFLPFEHARAVAGVGTLSRNDGVDKFSRFGLRATPGAVTGSPMSEDAYLAYECRLTRRVPTGDHEWWVGDVVALHHRPGAFDERGLLRRDVAPAQAYYGRATYASLGSGELATFPPSGFREPDEAGAEDEG